MGGGGPFFNPNDFNKKIPKSEEETNNKNYQADVNTLLRDLLTAFNDRDVEQIQKHLDTIKKALESDIEGSLDINYGGSVAKHTYVDGLSDIDTLAILNKSELENKSPQEVLDYFLKRLKERLPNTEMWKGDLAVTLKFSDKSEIQILPALKEGDKLKIANPENNTWTRINPKKFADKLTKVNKESSSKLVPVIKLAKSIISDYPKSRQLSGYHVESLAINIFENYKGTATPKAMLKHFFKEASSKVLSPIKDKTGQSIHVDGYKGTANSLSRKMSSDSLNATFRKISRADDTNNSNLWKNMFKE